MARVFISYRRDDGLSWVGWLAERLEQIEGVQGVQSAFHDDELRAGDNFQTVLDDEIESCDVVIAMIGKRWLGVSEGGLARAEEADDWIVRELSSALVLDKRVLPVLVDGQNHPLASQVHPSIAAVSELHAVPFASRGDLDQIENHVRSHLDELDRERALLAGLEAPVELPAFPRPLLVAVLSVLAALVAGLATVAVLSTLPQEYVDAGGFEAFAALTAVMAASMWGLGVLFVAVDRWVGEVAIYRWREVLIAVVVLIPIIQIVALNFAEFPSDWTVQAAVVIWPVSLAVTPLWVAFFATAATVPRASPHDLAGRAKHYRVLIRANRLAVVLGLIFVVPMMLVLGVQNWFVSELGVASYSFVQTASTGVFMSGVLLAGWLWTNARMAAALAPLAQELDKLPQKYRSNAGLDQTESHWLSWAVGLAISMPALVGLVSTLLLSFN